MNDNTLRSGFVISAHSAFLCFVARLLASVVCFSAVATVAFAHSPSGVVEGRVFNAANGNALVNARVTLEGTSREAITDESGSFRIAGVPAGSTTLRAFYLGMTSET